MERWVNSISLGISHWSMSLVAASRICCSIIALRRSQSRFYFYMLAAVLTAVRHTSKDLLKGFSLLLYWFYKCYYSFSNFYGAAFSAGFKSIWAACCAARAPEFYKFSGRGLICNTGGPLFPTSWLAGRLYMSFARSFKTSKATSPFALLSAY